MDDIEFVHRQIAGVNHKFLTPKHDYGTFEFIARDWIQYAPRWSEFITNHDVAIQAGGNCGLYAYLLGRKFETVYTFEPDPYSFYCLSDNLKSNKFVKLNLAISDKCGPCRIASVQPYGPDRISNNDGILNRVVDGKPMFNTGQSQLHSKGHMQVHAITIDSLNVNKCDLIFLDIEGHEYKALKGATKTIAKYRPTVILECSNDKHKPILQKLGYEMLVSFGYPDNEIWRHKDATI